MDNNRTPEKIEEAEEKTAVTESTKTTETAVTEEKKPSKGKAKKIIIAIVAVILVLAGIAALIYTIYWETQKSKAKKYLEGKIFITDEYEWSVAGVTKSERDVYSFKDGYIAMEHWESFDSECKIEGDITSHDVKYRIKKDLDQSYMSIYTYDSAWEFLGLIKLDNNAVKFVYKYSDWQETTLEEVEEIKKQYSCEHKYKSSVTKEPTNNTPGERTYVCRKCDHTYVESYTKHIVPTSVLDKALTNSRYYNSPFSITVGKLVNSAMDNYKIKYLTGEEAIAQRYLSKNQIDSSIDIDYVYYAIISGDSMVNPDIPYMTEYEKEAVKVWMVFDENDELLNSGVTLSSNLETCAIILMTSSY